MFSDIPQNENEKNFVIKEGKMEDLPENVKNHLKAIVPTEGNDGKKSYKIFIVKDNKSKKKILLPKFKGKFENIHSKYLRGILSMKQANKIASKNIYDTGGNTMDIVNKKT